MAAGQSTRGNWTFYYLLTLIESIQNITSVGTTHLGPVSCLRQINIVHLRTSVLAGRVPPKLNTSARFSYRWLRPGLPPLCELAVSSAGLKMALTSNLGPTR
jgi:hypothetical protein